MKECINCAERHPACQDSCPNHAKLKEKKELERKRYKEFNNSVGWDGYIQHNKKYRTV